MTVPNAANKIIWLGNGATSVFTYSFPIPAAADVVLTYTDASGNQTVLGPSQYTITGLGTAGGGTVTYPISGPAIAPGTSLTLQRVVPYLQATSLANQGGMWPSAVEGADDYLTYQTQQLAEQVGRAIVGAPGDASNVSYALPAAAARAGQFLGFDSQGDVIAAQPSSGAPISAAMQPVVDAATTALALVALGAAVPIATVAALRANTTVSSAFVCLLGYASVGDGGEGVFLYNAADASSADDGGTIIVDASGRRWHRTGVSAGANVRWFGAVGDGTTDDTAAIQAAINAAQARGFAVFIPVGTFLVSATLNITAPVTIRGVNPGSGAGAVDSSNASIILCAGAFKTGDVLSAVTNYGCLFRDFQIAGALGLVYTSACPRTSGAGIHVSGPTGATNMGSKIENIAFSGVFIGVQLTRCQENTVTRGCYFQAWGDIGFYAENGNTAVESSCGYLSNNQFFGNLGAAELACAQIHCGYGAIYANKFLGARYGLQVYADQTVSIGNVIVSLNSFEENSVQGIYITQSGAVKVTSVEISNNQFSNITEEGIQTHVAVQPEVGGSASDLYDINISGNNFASQMTGAAATCIITNASNVTIANNRMSIIGGSAYGIAVEASSPNTAVLDNQIFANGGTLLGPTGYLLQDTTTLLRDLRSGAFTAALLPAVANGSAVYASDGHTTTSTNQTVIGGGGGCIAWRNRSAWLALVGLT